MAKKSNTQNKPAKKSPDNAESKPKTSFAKIQLDLRKWMDGDLLVGMQSFGHELLTVRTYPKAPVLIFHVVNGTAVLVDSDYVTGLLSKALEPANVPSQYLVDYDSCKKVVAAWLGVRNHASHMPRFIGFESTPEVCLFRHKFDPAPVSLKELKTLAPVFYGITQRMTNRYAFCLRLGSIYDKEAPRKQINWIYGETQGGKSVITDLLNLLCGDDYFTPVDPSDIRKADAIAELNEIRVAIVNECPLSFLTSRMFKILTGGEKVRGRNLYQKAIKFVPDVLLFAVSDQKLQLPDDDAIKERLILNHLTPIPKRERLTPVKVKRALAEELPYIIGYCLRLWDHHKGKDRSSLPCSTDAIEEAVDLHLARYHDFVDHYIAPAIRPGAYVENAQLYALMMNEGFRKGTEQKKLHEFIEKQFPGSRRYRPYSKGKRSSRLIFEGISLKTTYPRQYKTLPSEPISAESTPLDLRKFTVVTDGIGRE
jgi:hypothetical protein